MANAFYAKIDPPNVGGVLGANFAKFVLTDFAQKRLNRFRKKSPIAREPLIMGGSIFA